MTQVAQKTGQIIATAPAAYHGGYNAGGNVTESVNFTIPHWANWVG